MYICYTKKLCDAIGRTPVEQESQELFRWRANVITLNRRKTVVVANDATRFGFVLYGLKAKDFKRLE